MPMYYRSREILAGASADDANLNLKMRRRLTPEGRKLVQDYVDSVHGHGRRLTLAERKELLRQVQAVPGCDFYSLTNLNTWLQNHQYSAKPPRDTTTPPARAGGSFPTLTQPMRAQLAALLALEPPGGPAPEKTALWAAMLAPAGAAPAEVRAYVDLQRDYARIKALRALRPPTPTSPSPARSPASVSPVVPAAAAPAPVVAFAGAHAYYAERAPKRSRPTQLSRPAPRPPVVSKPALPTRVGARVPWSRPAPAPVPPPPAPTPGYPSPALDADAEDMSISPEGSRAPTPAPTYATTSAPTQTQTQTQTPAPERTLRASILQGVADALAAPRPAGAAPRTAAEFCALFAAYEAPLAQILCALES